MLQLIDSLVEWEPSPTLKVVLWFGSGVAALLLILLMLAIAPGRLVARTKENQREDIHSALMIVLLGPVALVPMLLACWCLLGIVLFELLTSAIQGVVQLVCTTKIHARQ